VAAYLARIHAMNGEAGRGVALLRPVLATRLSIDSAGSLRLDPLWDPIRKDPVFAELIR
jgi:hypothetical protein